MTTSRNPRRIGTSYSCIAMLVSLVLLAVVSSASAECAWILWV